MLTRLITYLLSTGLLLGWTSCTERMDIDLEDAQKRLVVYGTLTTDTTNHTVRLSQTSNYLDEPGGKSISDAQVRITGSDEAEFHLTEKPSQPGVYETDSNIYGREGVRYTLHITNVDINNDGETETYKATDRLKPKVEADSIQVRYSEDFFPRFEIVLFADEPGGKQFYVFRLYKNNRLLTDSLDEVVARPDEFIDTISPEEGITVQTLTLQKKDERPEPNDTITLELNSVTEQYYYFISRLQEETRYRNPVISGPPANVPSNLTNGAVGFFGTYPVERVSTVFTKDIDIPDEPSEFQ